MRALRGPCGQGADSPGRSRWICFPKCLLAAVVSAACALGAAEAGGGAAAPGISPLRFLLPCWIPRGGNSRARSRASEHVTASCTTLPAATPKLTGDA